MARRRKAKRSSGGGGAAAGGSPNPTGAIVFLVLIAAVVAAIVLYNRGSGATDKPSVRNVPQPTPVTRTPPVSTPITPVPIPQIKQETPPAAQKSIQERLADIGPEARGRLKPFFAKARVAYPPSTIVLVVLKKEKSLELWAGDDPENFKPIASYRVLDISGHAGPKLREGDRQVPEGIYHVAGLNPNSKNSLSLLLDYPNEMDRSHAQQDGRSNLGGEITIHGGETSVSTIPVGPQAIEDLFTLAAEAGIQRLRVVIMPCDLRKGATPDSPADVPPWTPQLYKQIKDDLAWMTAPGA